MDAGSGGLEINEDLRFQRREWLVQRVGWATLMAFVLAAVLGLFGDGPLSRARAGDPTAPLWVEYQRFVRVGAPHRLSIHVQADTADPHGGLELRVNRAYFEAMRVERLTPEPQSIVPGSTGVRLQFSPQIRPPFTIVVESTPQHTGPHPAEFQVSHGDTVVFRQFAYF